MFSPQKEKSSNKSFSIKFHSPKSWQLQGHILPQKWIKRGLRDDPEEQTPEGLLSWQSISKTYFPSSGVRLCLQSKVWLSFIIVGLCRRLKALIFLYYIHRKPYWFFVCFFFSQKVSLWGQDIWRHLYHVPKYTVFTLSRCWRTAFLPSSLNSTRSCSPHGSRMVDELLGSQKELHSWKMMKPRIHFLFPPPSLADSSDFYHSKCIRQKALATSELHSGGCCTDTQCVRSYHAQDKKIITSLPQAPPLS